MKNSILKNAVYLFASNVLVRLITAVATILVARYLGAKDYGALSVGLALSSIAGYFTDMGLTHTLIREGTKPNPDIPRLLGGAFKLRLIFASVTAIVSSLIFYFFYREPLLRSTIYFIVIPTIFGGALQGVGVAYYQMIQEMQYVALIRSFSGLITAGTLFISIFFRWPLQILALSYGFSSLIGGILSVVLVKKHVPNFGGWHKGLTEGLWSFTVGGLLVMILPQLGPIILEKVASLQEVGYFSAAYRIPALLYQIPGILAAAFYPQLFFYGARDHEEHFKLSKRELKFMSLLGLGLALPFILYPEWILKILFGSDWSANAGKVLGVLAWMVAFQGINYPLADALTTQGLQSRRTYILSLAFIIGIFSYINLGKYMGAYGAAFAAIIIEITCLNGYTLGNPRGFKLLMQGLARPIRLFIIAFAGGLLFKVLMDVEWIAVGFTVVFYSIVVILFDTEIKKIIYNKKDETKCRVMKQI